MADSRLGIYSRNSMFVDDGTVTVNGTRLGDMGWYLTSAPEVDAISFDTSYTTVTGAHGSRDLSLTDGSGLAYAGRRMVTLHLRTVGTWQEDVKSKVALGVFIEVDAERNFAAGATAVIETSPTKSRGVYINGVLTCPTLTSDFFDLPVGDSTITVVGASSITTSFEPLWLIP